MAEATFYRCPKCGKVVAVVGEGVSEGLAVGEMEVLVAGTTDGAREKHVPSVVREGSKVKVQVGSVEHPMLESHYIEFVAVISGSSASIAYLSPGQAPVAEFDVAADEPVLVYEYCNLHGLWMAEA